MFLQPLLVFQETKCPLWRIRIPSIDHSPDGARVSLEKCNKSHFLEL